MPNPMTPNIQTALPNLGFGGMSSRPEPSFFGQGGGFQSFGSNLRQITRPLAAGFAKDPNYRAIAAQQIATEQQMQQEQAAQLRKMVIEASLDNLGTLAESVRGVGSQTLMENPNSLKYLQRALESTKQSLVANGWDPNDADALIEQYGQKFFIAADMPKEQTELQQKLAELDKLGATEEEKKKALGAYIEPTKGEAPIFQDIIGEGGVKIPGVSYDGGKSFRPMTAENMFGGGQFRGGFEDAVQFVLGQEGGYVDDDAGQGPTNMGINAPSNEESLAQLGVTDVKDLTADQAVQIYKEKYWDALNLDSLPPSSQIVAFDAAVNQGQDFAAALIRGAGNDPQKMINLRRQAYENLAKSPKYEKYLPTWNKRLDDLSAIVGSGNIDVSKYAAPETDKNVVIKTMLYPDGVTTRSFMADDRAGIQAAINEGAVEIDPTAELKVNTKKEVAFEEKSIAVRQLEAQAERIKKKLLAGTKVGGVAEIGQALQGLSAQAEMLGDVFGTDTSILDPAQYTEALEDNWPAASAALQSDIIGLAYAQALANNPDGQVRNSDVNNALREIGAQGWLTSREQLTAALDSMVERAFLNLEIEAEERNFKAPKRKGASEENIPDVKSDADYMALPKGSRFRDPEGNIRVKP